MLRCEQNWCGMDLMMRLVKEETNKTLLKRYVSESESGSISAGGWGEIRWQGEVGTCAAGTTVSN